MSVLSDISVPCPFCNQGTAPGEPLHRICGLRSALGGIGHLLDHHHWCVVVEDTDAGLSLFDSARCVDALVARYGLEAVVDGAFPRTTLSEVCGWAGMAV